jgi:hypothetical protein
MPGSPRPNAEMNMPQPSWFQDRGRLRDRFGEYVVSG